MKSPDRQRWGGFKSYDEGECYFGRGLRVVLSASRALRLQEEIGKNVGPARVQGSDLVIGEGSACAPRTTRGKPMVLCVGAGLALNRFKVVGEIFLGPPLTESHLGTPLR